MSRVCLIFLIFASVLSIAYGTITSVSASASLTSVGSTGSVLTINFQDSLDVVSSFTVTMEIPGFTDEIAATPTVIPLVVTNSAQVTTAAWVSSSSTLTFQLDATLDANVESSFQIALDSASQGQILGSSAGSHTVRVKTSASTTFADASAPIVITGTIGTITPSLSQTVAGSTGAVLTIAFQDSADILVGDTITIIVPGIDTEIAAVPTVTPVTVTNSATVASAAWSTNTLTIITATGILTAGTTHSFSVPLDAGTNGEIQSTAIGSHTVQLSTTNSPSSVSSSTPLVITATGIISSVSASSSQTVVGQTGGVLTFTFTDSGQIAVGDQITVTIPGFTTEIATTPTVTAITVTNGAGTTAASWDSSSHKLRFNTTNGILDAATAHSFSVPLDAGSGGAIQASSAGSHFISVRTTGAPVAVAAATAIDVVSSLISSVTVSFDVSTVGSIATITFSFTDTAEVAIGETVTVTIPGISTEIADAPTVTPVTVTNSATTTNAAWSSSTGILTFDIATGSLTASTSHSFSVTMTNKLLPSSIGSYYLSVHTTQSTSDVASSAAFVITATWNAGVCNLDTLNWGSTYTKGEKGPPLCLTMGRSDRAYNMSIFWPEVDEFTKLEITGSYGTGWIHDYIQAEIEKDGTVYLSGEKMLHDNNFYYWVPFLTLIISLKDGEIDKFEWDSGCLTCSSSSPSCVDDFCGVEISECANGNENCNIQVYVGWFGTDADGNYLTSAAQRQSAFRDYSLDEIGFS